jgi:hypothetical protein
MSDVAPTAILTIDYWYKSGELLITFVNGRSYAYASVPRRLYDQFIVAPSHGAFFNAYIRDQYHYRPVSGC